MSVIIPTAHAAVLLLALLGCFGIYFWLGRHP